MTVQFNSVAPKTLQGSAVIVTFSMTSLKSYYNIYVETDYAEKFFVRKQNLVYRWIHVQRTRCAVNATQKFTEADTPKVSPSATEAFNNYCELLLSEVKSCFVAPVDTLNWVLYESASSPCEHILNDIFWMFTLDFR